MEKFILDNISRGVQLYKNEDKYIIIKNGMYSKEFILNEFKYKPNINERFILYDGIYNSLNDLILFDLDKDYIFSNDNVKYKNFLHFFEKLYEDGKHEIKKMYLIEDKLLRKVMVDYAITNYCGKWIDNKIDEKRIIFTINCEYDNIHGYIRTYETFYMV